MQTFLPHPDPARSARDLDRRRLGKQRVETLQILRALMIPHYGWAQHPAVQMSSGHVPALVAYGAAMVDEWAARGGRDSTRWKIAEFAPEALDGPVEMPPWLGDPQFHASHRSSLIAKDEQHYRPLWPEAATGLEAVWPEPPIPHEPPQEASPGERAWVVSSAVLHDDGLLLPTRAVSRTTAAEAKRRPAQLQRLRVEATPGQIVIVPLSHADPASTAFAAEREHAVEGPQEPVVLGVLGDGQETAAGIRRGVEWGPVTTRSALGDPWQLQRPRVVFPIRRPR